MAIQPTQPQSIGGVLDVSFQLYKASLGSVWPICLLLVLGSGGPSLYLLMQGATITPNPDNPMAALAIFSDPKYWLANLISIVVSMWVTGAMYLKLQSIAGDAELGLGSALQASLGRLPTQLGALVLYSIGVGAGLLLLLVPGLILMVSLMLCWIIAVVEGKGPLESLTGSHRLIWGNWWRTTAILTVGFIILIVLYIAVAMVVGMAIPFVGLGDDPLMIGFVSGLIVSGFIYLLVTPYYIALLLSIYWDLKLRREGGDLAARVGALGAA
jgi:hypothetical protein